MVWPLTVALLIFAGIPALDLLLLGTHRDPQTAWIEGVAARKQAALRLDRHTGRLLIAGGSSALFSVDAELLEARIGIPSTISPPTPGWALRTCSTTRATRRGPGDTVLLYLEYAQYVRKPLPLSPLQHDALWTCHPARLLHLPASEALLQIFANPLDDYRQGWERRNLEMAPPPTDEELRPYSRVELGPRGYYRSNA